MKITEQHIESLIGKKITTKQQDNARSILAGLDTMGVALGLTTAQRLAQYLAQVSHESGRFAFDKEVWGPTVAQARYDVRTDLGNTPERDGDGKKYSGRAGIQITGKANYISFRDWCWAQGLKAPDFETNPDAVNSDPWEGLAPLWYWSTRNLNRFADAGNIEMITKKINGGLNGFDDRIGLYVRISLIFLGRPLTAGALKVFQADNGLTPDDIPGPATRGALHMALGAIEAVPAAPAPIALPEPVSVEPEPVSPAAPAGEGYTIRDYLDIAKEAMAGIERKINEQA